MASDRGPIPTDDLRISATRPLVPPAILHEELPITPRIASLVSKTRSAISRIIHGQDRRLIAIVGPCSIHDPHAALEYAGRLEGIARPLSDRLVVIMRAYFEKPRTTVGWKGFINDPNLDESFEINKGLRLARKLLIDINDLGLPTGSEFLDMQIPQHIADITSWVAIGARTTESQVHRELASGLSMPVGFKNSTEGNVSVAIDAVSSARQRHWFPSVTKQAVGAIFQTTGNPDCHIILRGGGKAGTNFDEESVSRASSLLEKRGLPARVMIDCSHANARKDHRNQRAVLCEIARQISGGSQSVMGVMLESNLVEGRQDKPAVYGQSITDACISIGETEELLIALAEARR